MTHTTIIIHSNTVSAAFDDGTPLDPSELKATITYTPDDNLTPSQVAARIAEILRLLHKMEEPGG